MSGLSFLPSDMADSRPSSRLLDIAFVLAVIYIGYVLVFKIFFPVVPEAEKPTGVMLRMEDTSVRTGVDPILLIENHTEEALEIPARCPMPPVDLFFVSDAAGEPKDVTASDPSGPCTALPMIEPGATARINLGLWKYTAFAEKGTYEVRLPSAVSTATGGTLSARFEVSDPGFLVQAFRGFIMKPLLNALIFIASILPGHDLGAAILLLTILVKLLLFLPTQHALEGQKKMQLLQPKFEEIRRLHKENPQKMQEETMKLWKEHKVNPFQACLPLLVQFPVLIGLFYVVRDGGDLALSRHLIYPIYEDLQWTFDTSFLGLDLTKPYVWLFPPMLVLLQFVQMKLSFTIADRKKAKEIKEKTTPQADTPQEVQQRIMLYALPLMIGFFALKFPSAVSLYWGISTVFAIGQQMIVNREHISVRASS